ncbi:DUF4123 domain-containing protein [Ralstonia pseudosolanacearum]|uniref:DUF4123 domain-containing protein n=1 Tax=Ralstonia pseudosolanacearum TaxID=1310165 RepID=UPI002003A8C7|nr:DUF4123 domain-containing protein [Ralstonia pseudosolanacearum]MCK4139991.1 DUF4123 domain-containing protein [Ralstonia pseudosolanacearum]
MVADIGDGQTAILRFFDPRNLAATLSVLDAGTRERMLRPILFWHYRDQEGKTVRINGGINGSTVPLESPPVVLGPQQLEALNTHSEPSQLLSTLVNDGEVDGSRRFRERFAEFLPRFRRAVEWGLAEPADRLRFCHRSYAYGAQFDRHPQVAAVLEQRKRTGEPLADCLERVPARIWDELSAAVAHSRPAAEAGPPAL